MTYMCTSLYSMLSGRQEKHLLVYTSWFSMLSGHMTYAYTSWMSLRCIHVDLFLQTWAVETALPKCYIQVVNTLKALPVLSLISLSTALLSDYRRDDLTKDSIPWCAVKADRLRAAVIPPIFTPLKKPKPLLADIRGGRKQLVYFLAIVSLAFA